MVSMNIDYETQQTLERVWTGLRFEKWKKTDIARFKQRYDAYFPRLFQQLLPLYGHHYDLFYYLTKLCQHLADAFRQTAVEQDEQELWYRSEKMVGMALYVDLFADDLSGLMEKIPYLTSLGVNYLHLMPLYKAPEGNSDGGYAVSDYRMVNSKLGTVADLSALADALHEHGIKLVLDFVFNHTSDEHEWAQKALSGEQRYQEFYYFFDDENEVKTYNETVREIFPQVRRGSFTYLEQQRQWVWTTFNSFQWDLNYSNPDVFVSVVDEMLFLAGLGCDVLRLDALAFIWKEKGTVCENLPKAHTLIRAFNSCLRIAAPQVLFKSEAIVHPDQVLEYIDRDECELSYNPLAMALQWEALATRHTTLLTRSLQKSFNISADCAWVNYIRCHDDIGWTWDDALSNSLGINGGDHRRFLNQFYTGQFPGSFASGVPFQENPVNGDCRVCGTLASLTGVEQALQQHNELYLEHALKRIALLNAVNLSLGGIPLLYQGDEQGVLNDFAYLDDADKRDDARWVNRKHLTEADFSAVQQPGTVNAKIFAELKRLIGLRTQHTVFGSASTRILNAPNPHVLSFVRRHDDGSALWVLANYSEHEFTLHHLGDDELAGQAMKDLISGANLHAADLHFTAYQVYWLTTQP